MIILLLAKDEQPLFWEYFVTFLAIQINFTLKKICHSLTTRSSDQFFKAHDSHLTPEKHSRTPIKPAHSSVARPSAARGRPQKCRSFHPL